MRSTSDGSGLHLGLEPARCGHEGKISRRMTIDEIRLTIQGRIFEQSFQPDNFSKTHRREL